MLNKPKTYQSNLILIQTRTPKISFAFPVPLYLLDQTLDAISDLAWLAELLWRIGGRHRIVNRVSGGPAESREHFMVFPTQAIELLRELLRELRSYGKWRMVEVEKGNYKNHDASRIYIDFI